MSKTMHDPLAAITRELASQLSSSDPSRALPNRLSHRTRDARTTGSPPLHLPKRVDPTSERLNRESSERERALALIRRKKWEAAGGETPSTVHGDADGRYGDVFNRREVEEAHAQRDLWRRRHR